MEINVGIIGLGRMGRLHMMNCLQLDDVRVVAAADKSKTAMKRAASFGVKNLYEDYREMIDNYKLDMDAVIISLPNFLHFQSIEASLEAGLIVFVEKPMVATVEEGKDIVRMVDENDRKFMVGHSMRFIDAIEKMKDAAENGYIGRLEVLNIEEIQNGPFSHPAVPKPVPEWWFDPKKTGGGVLLDLGYHLIDLFRFFAGDSELMFSHLDHRFNLPFEDGAIVLLQSSDSSVKGIVNVGWYQKSVFPKFNFRLIVHGNAGYISSDDLIPKNPYFHAAKEGTKNLLRRLAGRKIRPLSWTYWYESYYKELKHFFDCINENSEPSVSARDGLGTIELIEQAYNSFKANQS